MSRKGRAPSWFGLSTVNCMCGSDELMCCSRCWLCFASQMTKVSPTYLSHKLGLWGRAKGLDFKLFHKQVGNEGLIGEPMTAPWTCSNTYLGRGSMCFLGKLQECDDLFYGHVGPLGE